MGESLSLAELSVRSFDGLDPRTGEIVVTARKDTLDAIRFLDHLGLYDKVEQKAFANGFVNTPQHNAFFRNEAALLKGGARFSQTIGSPAASVGGSGGFRGSGLFSGREVASIGLDVLPFIGAVKAGIQLVSGRDYVAGGPVNRWTEAGGIILGMIPFGRVAGKVVGKVGGPVVDAAEGAIPKIGGRVPINSRYAGQVHPSGVEFTKQGFPNFRPYSQAEVEIPNLTGRYSIDSRLANEAMGYPSTPKGYVWHHAEDGATMQLIPKSVHNSVRHTGGAAVIRNGGFD